MSEEKVLSHLAINNFPIHYIIPHYKYKLYVCTSNPLIVTKDKLFQSNPHLSYATYWGK